MTFKRAAILLGLAAVGVAGCSSDNKSNADGVCGDGVVDTGEQCDDGNTTSGDGCSSVCKTEGAGSICGDGIVNVATEQCDDGNTTDGDGCSSDCRTEVPNNCGNGTIDTGETCDDGNQNSADGCNGACQVEMGYMCTGTPSVCTLAPVGNGTCASPTILPLAMTGSTYAVTATGNTSASTNQVGTATCSNHGSEGGGTDLIYQFTNPVAQKVTITLNNHITATATFDGLLRLTSAVCDATTDVAGNTVTGTTAVADGCVDSSTAAANEVLTYATLPAGTYFVVVDGYTSGEAGAFSLSINAGTATCGNGFTELGEGCDDHNTTAADGCGATCTVEPGYTCTTASPSVCVVTPGSCAAPTALTLVTTGTMYNWTGNSDTTNALNGVGGASCDTYSNAGAGPDQTWTFTNPVAQRITITLDGVFDSTLRLTTAACNLATQVPDTTADGLSDGCSEIGFEGDPEVLEYPNLPAGTYYVLADGYGAGEFGTYTLTVHGQPSTCGNGVVDDGEVCDDHNLVNGDGCSKECQTEGGFACTGTPSVCVSTCGDGVLDTGEGCDDGNTTAGDGCDATCHVQTGYVCDDSEPSVCHVIACGDGIVDGTEECDAGAASSTRCTTTCTLKFDTTETEPNNTKAAAQVLTPVHHIIKGSLPVGDRDIFTFTLTATSKVQIETYTTYESGYTSTSISALGLECVSADTLIYLYNNTQDPTQDTTVLAKDDDDGDHNCSYLGPLDAAAPTQGILPAGTYYFAVHEFLLDDAINRYLIDFNVSAP